MPQKDMAKTSRVGFGVGFWGNAVIAAHRNICDKFGKKKKKLRNRQISELKVGADSQIRTGDLILTKDALDLLSYISKLYAP